MKSKRTLIICFISILILSLTLSIKTFAVTLKNKDKNITSITNTVDNEVNNETENKTKNKVKNKVKNEAENVITNNVKSSISKKENSLKSDEVSKRKIINEDIVSLEADRSIEYKNLNIKGNVFLANVDKVTIENVRIAGDLVVFSSNIEIINSRIDGSMYSASKDKIVVSESQLNSIYCTSDKIEIEEGTEISRELRAIGSNISINGEIGKDLYAYAENVKFGDEAKVLGKTVVKSESKNISENSYLKKLDYDNINFSNKSNSGEKIITYLIEKGTEIVIILFISIFLIYGFPKFTEVNSCLRLRDFFKALFTGILELIIILAIIVGLFITGYGLGYGLILLNLLITFIILGKVIFIISFAIRLSCNPNEISNIKALFSTVLVAIILAIIEMVSLCGITGIIINIIINCVLALVGFGSMFRVIFTSKKKIEILSQNKLECKKEKARVVDSDSESVNDMESDEKVGHAELQAEIKSEIKKEINELKKEFEEEKNLEKIDLSDNVENSKEENDNTKDFENNDNKKDINEDEEK